MLFCQDHWEENSGQVWKISAVICRSTVLKFIFTPIGSHVNDNEKNSLKT